MYPTVSNSLCVLPPSLLQVDYVVIASQAGATLNNLMSHAQELVGKLRSLQLDQREFVCLKFLVLFSLGEYYAGGGWVGEGRPGKGCWVREEKVAEGGEGGG